MDLRLLIQMLSGYWKRKFKPFSLASSSARKTRSNVRTSRIRSKILPIFSKHNKKIKACRYSKLCSRTIKYRPNTPSQSLLMPPRSKQPMPRPSQLPRLSSLNPSLPHLCRTSLQLLLPLWSKIYRCLSQQKWPHKLALQRRLCRPPSCLSPNFAPLASSLSRCYTTFRPLLV